MRQPNALLVSALLLAACQSGTTVTRTARFATQPPDKVDILFVIDNTASRPFQELLALKVGPIADGWLASTAAVNYHIGVITSDNGANSFVDSLQQCTPGSDQYGAGRLQAKGEAADPACQKPTGGNYVEIDRAANTTNLPTGQDLTTTLHCMLDVGGIGCGFEQPLETTYKTLTDPTITENAGFFRDDALLAIFYLMDEDDCSAPSTSNVYDREPSTPPPEGLGLLSSYRCNKWGIVCFNPATRQTELMPYGAATGLLDCRPASAVQGNRLYDIERYTTLFTKPKSEGGVKANPEDVMLFGIFGDPPPTLETVKGNPNFQGPDGNAESCDGDFGQNCAVLIKHACVNDADKRFFADPAVRLATVVRAAPSHRVHSICDMDYASPLDAMAAQLAVRTEGTRCLPYAVDNVKKCEVSEANHATQKTTRTLARCDDTATNKPCWRLGTDTRCDRLDGDPTLVIERDDAAPVDADYVLRCVD